MQNKIRIHHQHLNFQKCHEKPAYRPRPIFCKFLPLNYQITKTNKISEVTATSSQFFSHSFFFSIINSVSSVFVIKKRFLRNLLFEMDKSKYCALIIFVTFRALACPDKEIFLIKIIFFKIFLGLLFYHFSFVAHNSVIGFVNLYL